MKKSTTQQLNDYQNLSSVKKGLKFLFIFLFISNQTFAQVEICNNGLDDDSDGLIDCADPDCNPGVNYFSNPSMEDFSTCPNLSTSSTINFADNWKTSGGTGGQLMVADPGSACHSPRPGAGWIISTELDSGSHGKCWLGAHQNEVAQVDLIAPLPVGSYTFQFDAGHVSITPHFFRSGDMDFYGVEVGASDFSTSNLLGKITDIDNLLDSGNQDWKSYSLSFNTTKVFDRILLVVRGTNTFLYFDNFRFSQPDPKIAFQDPNDTLASTATLRITNKQSSWSSYQWYKNGMSIPGAVDSTYQPTSTGNYTVKAVYTNGCESESSNEITITGVGVACNMNSPVPNMRGVTLYSSVVAKDGDWNCYCDATGQLLLALDTNGSGAQILANGISLKMGAGKTLSWLDAGGIISNEKGGAIMDRRWNVAPTRQPDAGKTVKVRFFFANDEYLAVKDTLANHNGGDPNYVTLINNPTELNMFKIRTSGSFLDPHSNSVQGLILAHGTIPDTNKWVHSSPSANNHAADFLVSSFSGGGGGAGGGGVSALPIRLVNFEAKKVSNNLIHVFWTTASQLNNREFIIERSYNGHHFEEVTRQQGENGQMIRNYVVEDRNFSGNVNAIYYRLKQIDMNGVFTYSHIRKVDLHKRDFAHAVNIYPNPSDGITKLTLNQSTAKQLQIKVIDLQGKEVFTKEILAEEGLQQFDLNFSHLKSGIYFIRLLSSSRSNQFKLTIK